VTRGNGIPSYSAVNALKRQTKGALPEPARIYHRKLIAGLSLCVAWRISDNSQGKERKQLINAVFTPIAYPFRAVKTTLERVDCPSEEALNILAMAGVPEPNPHRKPAHPGALMNRIRELAKLGASQRPTFGWRAGIWVIG
jgi:hypothetical protein